MCPRATDMWSGPARPVHHPYASVNWIRFIGSLRCTGASSISASCRDPPGECPQAVLGARKCQRMIRRAIIVTCTRRATQCSKRSQSEPDTGDIALQLRAMDNKFHD